VLPRDRARREGDALPAAEEARGRPRRGVPAPAAGGSGGVYGCVRAAGGGVAGRGRRALSGGGFSRSAVVVACLVINYLS